MDREEGCWLKMKNTTILALIGIIILLVGGFIFLNSEEKVKDTIDTNSEIEGEIQKVVISEKNLNYYPNTIKVKAGQPVSISLDSSVTGCLRAFTIKDLKILKYLRSPKDTLDFVPEEKGTYTFACSMGMGYGKLIVE